MMSQISGLCCDSDIEPDQYENFVWESHVRQKFSSSLKIFTILRNKIQLFSSTYILKIINACQDNIKHRKNCTDE